MAIERIRFHLDENVDPDIASALRQHGIDVTSTVEAQLRTAPDEAQFEFARRENRVIVTRDSGFLRVASRTLDHPGIAFILRSDRPLGEIIRALILVHGVLRPEETRGRVEFL